MTLHSPDGSTLLVERGAILAIKPIATRHRDHLPGQTRSVIFLDGRPTGFGLTESVDAVARLMSGSCK